MKNTNEKKITALKVHKVVLVLHTIALLALIGVTIYSFILKQEPGINYVLIGSNAALYSSSILLYEESKKKAAKKEMEEKEIND